MTHWLSDRLPAHNPVGTIGRRTDKPIVRIYLAHMARRFYLVPRLGEERGVAAGMLIARRHRKP